MAVKSKKWSDLSQRTRRLIIAVGTFEGILKVAALIDIKRRPADEIRGRKGLWALAVTFVNSAGLLPIFYFIFGRTQSRS
jgi:hypothetical protein